jgi:hypothetical protein
MECEWDKIDISQPREQQASEENGLRRALSLSMEIKNIKLSLFCVCVLEFSPGHKAGCTGHLYQRFFIGGFVQSGARLNVQNIIRHAAFKLQDDDLYTHAADSVSRSGKKF